MIKMTSYHKEHEVHEEIIFDKMNRVSLP